MGFMDIGGNVFLLWIYGKYVGSYVQVNKSFFYVLFFFKLFEIDTPFFLGCWCFWISICSGMDIERRRSAGLGILGSFDCDYSSVHLVNDLPTSECVQK